jgi:hypothetical protein
MLHDNFAEEYSKVPVFGAIVGAPRNRKSERFHQIIGFRECDVFDGHPDGKRRIILERPPAAERSIKLVHG